MMDFFIDVSITALAVGVIFNTWHCVRLGREIDVLRRTALAALDAETPSSKQDDEINWMLGSRRR